ncbi:MAG: hypothetical protein ACOX6I_05090 [Syntrophomonadaceae bacterium]|jgi:hypothetical protein
MNKILISIMIIMMLLSGCKPYLSPQGDSSQEVSPTETSDPIDYIKCLTLTEVNSALSHEGLKLIANRRESPSFYQIDDTMPAIFNVKDTNQMLLIYVFKTIGQLKQVYPYGGLTFIPGADILPQIVNYPKVMYAFRNVLMIDIVKTNAPQEVTSRDEQVLKALKNVAFLLNDTQRVAFANKGTHWDAHLVVDFYEHWYKDDNDTTQFDHDSTGKWTVKYIGPNPESIHNIKVEYNAWGNSGRFTDSGDVLVKTGTNYYLRIPDSNGTPDKESVPTISFEWNGQKESLDLKMIE